MTNFKPSKYQTEIAGYLKSYTTQKADAVVVARAGTGKSTTALWAVGECLKARPKAKILMTCFNRSVRDELAEKVDNLGYGRSVDVKTLHGLGLSLIMKAGRHVVKTDKYNTILRPLVAEVNEAKQGVDGWIPVAVNEVTKLLDLARGMLVDFDDAAALEGVCGDFDIGVSHDEHRALIIGLAQEALKIGTGPEWKKVVDQTDMIWYPCVFKEYAPRWTWSIVIVDEAQDMNPAQLKLARMVVSRKYRGRLICIGDPCQAIYGWRGADSGILGRMLEDGCKEFSLPVTYRCPKSVVAFVHDRYPGLVDDYVSASDREGTVATKREGNLLADAQPGDFVLSRANAPLLGLAIRLLKDGKAAKIRGRDFTTALTALIKKSGAEQTVDLLSWLDGYEAEELAAMERLHASERAMELLVDTVECLRVLASGHEVIDGVYEQIENLFTDRKDEDFILLSTVHRAKGLEAETAWLLWDTFNKRNSAEERFIGYVAATRAKENLYLVNTGS